MNLKELRIKKGMTQKQIGDILNLSSQAIGNYENGKRDLSIRLIPEYAAALDVPWAQVLFSALQSLEELEREEKKNRRCQMTTPTELSN